MTDAQAKALTSQVVYRCGCKGDAVEIPSYSFVPIGNEFCPKHKKKVRSVELSAPTNSISNKFEVSVQTDNILLQQHFDRLKE